MVAMPWPWVWVFPTILQITVFTLAALWYAFLVLFGSTAPSDPHGHHTSASVLRYHGGMMTAMVWMAVVMSPGGSVPWGTTVSTVLGVLFVIAAGWFVVRLILLAGGRRGEIDAVRILDAGASVLMASGMSIAFLVLVTGSMR